MMRTLTGRLVLFSVFSVLVSASAHAIDAGGATVLKLVGKITCAGKDLKVGDTLKGEDEITVPKSPNAHVDLKLSEGHIVRLKEGTQFKLGSFEKGLRILTLTKGKTFVHFKKSPEAHNLEVRTKAVVAGVRGTKFNVAIDDIMGTYICVCEGAVEARQGSISKTVAAGQDLWANTHSPMGNPVNSPGMRKMTEDEFASMNY